MDGEWVGGEGRLGGTSMVGRGERGTTMTSSERYREGEGQKLKGVGRRRAKEKKWWPVGG